VAFLDLPLSGGSRRARVYRRMWSVALGVLIGVGSVVSLISIPTPILIFVVAVSVIGGGSVRGILQKALFGRLNVARLVTLILFLVPASTAFAGWVVLIGLWALLLTILVCLSQPSVADYLLLLAHRIGDQLPTKGRRSGPVPDRSSRDLSCGPYSPGMASPATSAPALVEVRLPSTALTEISDRELYFAWRVSFVLLQRLQEMKHLQAQCRVVGLRQRYLDEMERRHPQGFARWLLAGARPASDPSRYLQPTEGR
jgi:hypothetical protein